MDATDHPQRPLTDGDQAGEEGIQEDIDDGDRLEFTEETVDLVTRGLALQSTDTTRMGKMVGNWVLHELGGLMTTRESTWAELRVTAQELADIIVNLSRKEITARVAKQLLSILQDMDQTDLKLLQEQWRGQ